MTDHELTLAEIKIQVDAAYDTYVDKINLLGGIYGIIPPSPRNWCRTTPAPMRQRPRLYAAFEAEQGPDQR